MLGAGSEEQDKHLGTYFTGCTEPACRLRRLRPVARPGGRPSTPGHYTPPQVYRKAVTKGFEFSLMVVGESGLGKSTLVGRSGGAWLMVRCRLTLCS